MTTPFQNMHDENMMLKPDRHWIPEKPVGHHVTVKPEPTPKNYVMKTVGKPETFGFDKALQLMKEGKRVKRKHWGGYWFIPGNWEATLFVGDIRHRFNPMIVACLKDDGGYAPATPYQEDILAEDWMEA